MATSSSTVEFLIGDDKTFTGINQQIENNYRERIQEAIMELTAALEQRFPFNDVDRELVKYIMDEMLRARDFQPSHVKKLSDWLKNHTKLVSWGSKTILPLGVLSIPASIAASYTGKAINIAKDITDAPVKLINGAIPVVNQVINAINKIQDKNENMDDVAPIDSRYIPLWTTYTDVFYDYLIPIAGVVGFFGSMWMLYKLNANYMVRRSIEALNDVVIWGGDTWCSNNPTELQQLDSPMESSVQLLVYLLKIIFQPSTKDAMPLLHGKIDIETVFKQAYLAPNRMDDDAIRQIREKLAPNLTDLVIRIVSQNSDFKNPYAVARLCEKILGPLLFILPILLNNLKNKKDELLFSSSSPEDYLLEQLAHFNHEKVITPPLLPEQYFFHRPRKEKFPSLKIEQTSSSQEARKLLDNKKTLQTSASYSPLLTKRDSFFKSSLNSRDSQEIIEMSSADTFAAS